MAASNLFPVELLECSDQQHWALDYWISHTTCFKKRENPVVNWTLGNINAEEGSESLIVLSNRLALLSNQCIPEKMTHILVVPDFKGTERPKTCTWHLFCPQDTCSSSIKSGDDSEHVAQSLSTASLYSCNARFGDAGNTSNTIA